MRDEPANPVTPTSLVPSHPPRPLARRIAAAAGWFHQGRGGLAAERLHLTLFILDDMTDVPPTPVETLRGVGASMRAGAFEVVLDVASGSGRSIALRPSHHHSAIAELRAKLAPGARASGVAERPGYRFAPHMALGYQLGAPFSERVAPVTWTADEIVLIDGQIGRTRHEVLGRWPLVDDSGGQLSLF